MISKIENSLESFIFTTIYIYLDMDFQQFLLIFYYRPLLFNTLSYYEGF